MSFFDRYDINNKNNRCNTCKHISQNLSTFICKKANAKLTYNPLASTCDKYKFCGEENKRKNKLELYNYRKV